MSSVAVAVWPIRLKIGALLLSFVVDVLVNSTEYDDLVDAPLFLGSDDDDDDVRRRTRTTRLFLFGAQLASQVTVFSILFACLCDTFLFRVGFAHRLAKRYSVVLSLHPIYFGLSLFVGARQIAHADRADAETGSRSLAPWDDDGFYFVLSVLQKAVAPAYYAHSWRAVTSLQNPIYFDLDACVDLLRDETIADGGEHATTNTTTREEKDSSNVLERGDGLDTDEV